MRGADNQIQLQIVLNPEKEIDRRLIAAKRYKLLLDVEGSLEITINSKRFFYDEYICLLEFGTALKSWLKDLQQSNLRDFDYYTMDNDDGPIIQFKMVGPDDWVVKSIWEEFCSNESFSTQLLTAKTTDCLKQLQNQLTLVHGIQIDDYLL